MQLQVILEQQNAKDLPQLKQSTNMNLTSKITAQTSFNPAADDSSAHLHRQVTRVGLRYAGDNLHRSPARHPIRPRLSPPPDICIYHCGVQMVADFVRGARGW